MSKNVSNQKVAGTELSKTVYHYYQILCSPTDNENFNSVEISGTVLSNYRLF